MVYNSLNGLTASYLCFKFIQWSDMVASYNLRSSGNKLAIPLPRTNYYKYSFSYSVSVPGNCLPSAQASNISN